jgi:hypothetical protein
VSPAVVVIATVNGIDLPKDDLRKHDVAFIVGYVRKLDHVNGASVDTVSIASPEAKY